MAVGKIIFLPLFCMLSVMDTPPGEYPVPQGISDLLFYVQRSMNINTIIYQLRTDKKGALISENPVDYYYINYAHKKEREEVSYIQKKLAYGISVRKMEGKSDAFIIEFQSVRKKILILMRSPSDNQYHVFVHINGRTCRLEKIFAQMGDHFTDQLKVKSISIYGTDMESNSKLVEVINPQDPDSIQP